MMKFRFSLLLSLGLALLLLFAACGDNNTGSGEVANDEDANTENNAQENQSAGTSDSEDVDEEIIVYARGGDSTSLDVSNNSDGEASSVTKNIFDSLLSYARDSFEVEPGLAHDWDIEDDGKRYIFYLEEGVTFHD